VDIHHYDVDSQEIDENQLIFVASFDTFSNQDGVNFFVKEIFPLIKLKHPKITFWIVGKDPPPKIREYSDEDPCIHVTGTVPDVREYISRSSICVVPLRIGGGSRLKILEALPMRKPVVSTSIGAEGLRLDDGKNIVIADNPEDFAFKVLSLLSDPSKRRKLGEAEWDLVRSCYDWKILAEKQDFVWKNLKRRV